MKGGNIMKKKNYIYSVSSCAMSFLVAGFLLCSGCSSGSASDQQKTPDHLKMVEYRHLTSSRNDYEDLSIDDLTLLNGTVPELYYQQDSEFVRRIDGKICDYPVKSPEEVIYALMGIRKLMGIETDNFTCTNIDETDSEYTVYTLYQMHNEVIVENAMFTVAVRKSDNIPVSVKGSYQRDLSIGTIPEYSAEETLQHIMIAKRDVLEETSLVIRQFSGDTDILCWKYVFRATDVDMYRTVYANAMTGNSIQEKYSSIHESNR